MRMRPPRQRKRITPGLKLQKRLKPSRSHRERTHWGWFVWGNNVKGRRVCLGPFGLESQAEEKKFHSYPDPGTTKVIFLPTISLIRAKQMCKAMDINDGKMVDDAVRYTSNESTLRNGGY